MKDYGSLLQGKAFYDVGKDLGDVCTFLKFWSCELLLKIIYYKSILHNYFKHLLQKWITYEQHD